KADCTLRAGPYMRVSLTASPPVVCTQRVCFPRAHNGLPHVAHLGRSSSASSLQFSLSSICTTSWTSCARTCFSCSSIAASISAHVAFGCSFLHWLIPSISRSPALTCCICSLRCRVFFFAFICLSYCFPLVYHLLALC